MVKSSVVDSQTGKSVDSTVRTSTGTFFQRGQDATISRIEDRIAQVSHLPVENGEGLQVNCAQLVGKHSQLQLLCSDHIALAFLV